MERDQTGARNLLVPALIGGVLGALVFQLIYPDPEWLVVVLFPGEAVAFQRGGAIPTLCAGLHYALFGLLLRAPGGLAKKTLIVLLTAQLGFGGYLLLWVSALPH